MNQNHEINANNCKENVNTSCCTLSRRKVTSFSRQTPRHGRCDGKYRNPDQVNLELSKVYAIPDLPIWAKYHKPAGLQLCWSHSLQTAVWRNHSTLILIEILLIFSLSRENRVFKQTAELSLSHYSPRWVNNQTGCYSLWNLAFSWRKDVLNKQKKFHMPHDTVQKTQNKAPTLFFQSLKPAKQKRFYRMLKSL